MSWIPENPGIVPPLSGISAAFGTVVSVVARLSRFNHATKARRTIEWINSTLDQDGDSDGRQYSLKKLRISQEAHLLAAHYVPWWRFMLLPIWMALFRYVFLYAMAGIKRNRMLV